MARRPSRSSIIALAAQAASLCACAAAPIPCPSSCATCVDPTLSATGLQAQIDGAASGTALCLRPGVYAMDRSLNLARSSLTLQGLTDNSGNGAVLDFAQANASRSAGLVVTGTALTLQDLSVQNTSGDAVSATGSSQLAMRRMRVSWTTVPSNIDGVSGLLVQGADHVTIEDCDLTGATGAGIDLRTSRNVAVRSVRLYSNAVGLATRNSALTVDGTDSARVEVSASRAWDNGVGFAVMRLPGEALADSERVLLRDCAAESNNRSSQAHDGSFWARLPVGVGVLVLGADRVELRAVRATGNYAAGFLVLREDLLFPDAAATGAYEPYPQGIFLQDGVGGNNGLLGVVTLYTTSSGALQSDSVSRGPYFDLLWDGSLAPGAASSSALCVATSALRYRDFSYADPTMATSDTAALGCTFTPLTSVDN